MREINGTTTKAFTTVSDQLIGEFKALMADAEALIEATDGHADDVIKQIRSKALKTLAVAQESVADFEGVITDKAKAVAESADDFVHHAITTYKPKLASKALAVVGALKLLKNNLN
jgi:ElaB/YqjD/DUF883 family membrane-anchored ribosome-binding protein